MEIQRPSNASNYTNLVANRLPKRSGAGVRGGCGGQAPGRANVVPKLAARSASSRRHGPARDSARIDAMRAGPPADICFPGGGVGGGVYRLLIRGHV